MAESAKSPVVTSVRLGAWRRLAAFARLSRASVDERDVFPEAVREAVEREEMSSAGDLASLPTEDLAEQAVHERDAIEQVVANEASRVVETRLDLLRARTIARYWLVVVVSGFAVTAIAAVTLLVLGRSTFLWVAIGVLTMTVVALMGPLAITSAHTLALPQSYASAVATYREGLLERGILPFLREAINRALARNFSLVLQFESARGLSELADEAFEVPTAATDHLQQLMEDMPGGSIGVAGPRGAGKSTLIRAFCAGRFRPPGGLAALVAAPVDYQPREFILHLYGSLCRAIVGNEASSRAFERRRTLLGRMAIAVGIEGLAVVGILLLIFDEVVPQLSGTQVLGVTLIVLAGGLALFVGPALLSSRLWASGVPAQDVPEEIVRDAQQRLERIRFLQSISSSWSGEVKFPIGGLSRSGGRTLIEQEASLPDLVEEFRSFATVLAQVADGLILGIDELDKIRDTDDAQQFMNDIKGVFGIPKCFFLISISEDALANFDRRGVPVRDAFDSSLDDVVRVGYLPLPGTRRLLQRRVVGLGEGFICLCHSLAAGLPRDIIRVARAAVREQPDTGPPLTLADLTGRLLGDDFHAKQSATTSALNSLGPLPEVGSALAWLRQLEPPERVNEIETFSSLKLDGHGDAERAALRVLGHLTDEFASFSYFSLTAREIFTQLDEPGLRQALDEAQTPFEALAGARQALAVHPRLAWDQIAAFRETHGLADCPVSVAPA